MPLLTVTNLTLRTDTGTPIFQHLNVDVHENDVLVLQGRSGSGKTTLLKCLAELNIYQEGEIRLHGKYVPGLTHEQLLIRVLQPQKSIGIRYVSSLCPQ